MIINPQEEVPWADRVDHLVAKEVSWMHLEVKVEEVLWEVLVAVEAVAQALVRNVTNTVV